MVWYNELYNIIMKYIIYFILFVCYNLNGVVYKK